MRSRIPLLMSAGVVALGVALVLILIQVSPQVRAGPPPPVTEFEATALRDSGRALTLANRAVNGVSLVEPMAAGQVKSPRPLAAAPDGSTLAVSTVDVGVIGPLTLARADGSQLEIALPGVRGAAFEPGGTWLAAVDLAGVLWRIETASGAASQMAIGPFAGDVSVLPDGRILTVHLSAVDAPLWASAEIVAESGAVQPFRGSLPSEEQLVYGATPMADGSVAIVRHRVGGGVAILRVDHDGAETVLTDLDGAAGVAVSPDGEALAWPADGTTWLAPTDAVAKRVAVGGGSHARFSPDGSLLLVIGPEATTIVDRTGSLIERAGPGACWAGGGRGCRP